MKKTLFVVLLMIISSFAVGCTAQNNAPKGALESSASDADSPSPSPSSSPSPSPSPSPAPSPSPSPAASSNSDSAPYEWGDNMETVRASDTSATLGTGGDILESAATISNIDMYLQYNFNKSDQLYELEYVSYSKHESTQGYIDDYTTLKADITGIFGEPANDSIIKEDARADKVDTLTALESGYVTYQTTWTPVDFYKPKDTSIRLLMISSDNKIHIGIFFDSIDIPGPESSSSNTDSPTPTSSPSTSANKDTEPARLEWGDNMETVKTFNPLAVQGTKGNTLEAPARLATSDALLQYYFNDSGQLYEMVFTSVTKQADTQGYLDEYKTIKAVSTRFLGEPTEDSILKKDNRANTVDALTALESGYTTYQTTWASPDFYMKDTKAQLILGSTSNKITIKLLYQSTDIPAS